MRFRYQDSTTQKTSYAHYAPEDFVWKLMQHVLPRGFKRVRDFGFLHPNANKKLLRAQALLNMKVKPFMRVKNQPICGHCKQPAAVILVLPKRIPLLFRAQWVEANRNFQPLPSRCTECNCLLFEFIAFYSGYFNWSSRPRIACAPKLENR